MAKHKGKRKPLSRKRYDEEHPIRSGRFTREENKCLDEHLKEAGCSFTEFVLNALNKEKSMIEERVKMLAEKRVAPVGEERLMCIESLMFQALLYLRDNAWQPICPHCVDQELLTAWGSEIESSGAHEEVPTLKCPKCGYFLDTPKRIDPKSLRWCNPEEAKSALKPKTPLKRKKRGTRKYCNK